MSASTLTFIWWVVVLLASVFSLYGFSAASSWRNFVLFLYIVLGFVPSAIMSIIQGLRLRSYLEDHHFELWKDVTKVPFFGAGGRNNFRMMAFAFSKSGDEDLNLKDLKSQNIRLFLVVLASFISIPLIGLLQISWR